MTGKRRRCTIRLPEWISLQRRRLVDRQNQFAGEAVRKLREAVVSNANVYIYGAAGFGKTGAV